MPCLFVQESFLRGFGKERITIVEEQVADFGGWLQISSYSGSVSHQYLGYNRNFTHKNPELNDVSVS
jgi:hypothetical protein